MDGIAPRGFEPRSRAPKDQGLNETDRRILEILKSNPKKAEEIRQTLGLSKPYIFERLKVLINLGYISKRGHYYYLTELGKKALKKSHGRLRIHNIWIKYKVLTNIDKLTKLLEKLRIEGKAERTTVNNWRKYQLELNVNGYTVKAWIAICPDEISVTFFDIPEFYVIDIDDALVEVINFGIDCRKALHEQFGIETSEKVLKVHYRQEVIFCEYAEKLPNFLPLTEHEIRLNRNAKDLQGKEMDIEARAWLDKSKGYWERETNDREYADDLLKEPIRVKRIEILEEDTNDRVKEIQQRISAIESLLFGSDGFLTKVTTTLQAFAEANEKFAINSNTHLQYMIEAKEVMSKMNQTMNGLNELINQLNSTVASIIQLQQMRQRKRSNGSSSSQKKQDKRVRYVSWVRIPKGRD